MSSAQYRLLALWAMLLTAIICFAFLPVSMLVALLLTLSVWSLIIGFAVGQRDKERSDIVLDNLPDAAYRQPVVLVCGDLTHPWPQNSPVLIVSQGCWIRVDNHQDLDRVARQLLWLRPEWGPQLSVMVAICPQQHTDMALMTRRLLSLRGQICQLRKETGQSIPLVLNGQEGSAMTNDVLWQAALPGEGVWVWRASQVSSSIASWVTTGGTMAMQQQVQMNSLMSWFYRHVKAVFIDATTDMPVVMPTAVLWGLMPRLDGARDGSVWTRWLSDLTALNRVTGWQPASEGATSASLPDFILPLLPDSTGLTPRQRVRRCALSLFTLAGVLALLSSAWNNHALIQRIGFDIAHYNRIPMTDYGPKAAAVSVLRQDADQLNNWARNPEPLRMSLGLYQGERLVMPVLEAIRTYVPPPVQEPAP